MSRTALTPIQPIVNTAIYIFFLFKIKRLKENRAHKIESQCLLFVVNTQAGEASDCLAFLQYFEANYALALIIG